MSPHWNPMAVRRLALVAGMAVMAFALVADAAEDGGAPAAASPGAAPNLRPDDPAVQAAMPGCLVWTDRCVACERTDAGIVCSNAGIACQPEPLICLRAAPAEKKNGRERP